METTESQKMAVKPCHHVDRYNGFLLFMKYRLWILRVRTVHWQDI